MFREQSVSVPALNGRDGDCGINPTPSDYNATVFDVSGQSNPL